MIRKLRRKFVLTNMLLVSLVLVIVFATLVASNYQKLTDQTQGALRAALTWSTDAPPPRTEIMGPAHGRDRDLDDSKGDRRATLIPVFVVTLAEDGTAATVNMGNSVDVSDEVVAQALSAAAGNGGTVPGLRLRYLRQVDAEGTIRVAFADDSWALDSLQSLIITSLLVGAAALVCFFLISLALSRLALRPVEAAWEQQRRFVADASHELKTPLTVILTNTGILLGHRDDTVQAQLKWVEYIREEAQRMKGLVEDLLFLAKNDAARDSAIPPAPTDLSESVYSALLPFEPVAFEAGAELESTIAPNLMVIGRTDQLRRLTTILLDNAVKYTAHGGKVTITLERGEKNTARLTVHNTGPAIPPEHMAHLFERFYRADDSRARASGGYGLGLAIAKSIVDAHRSTISIHSTDPHGTTFTIKFPLL